MSVAFIKQEALARNQELRDLCTITTCETMVDSIQFNRQENFWIDELLIASRKIECTCMHVCVHVCAHVHVHVYVYVYM